MIFTHWDPIHVGKEFSRYINAKNVGNARVNSKKDPREPYHASGALSHLHKVASHRKRFTFYLRFHRHRQPCNKFHCLSLVVRTLFCQSAVTSKWCEHAISRHHVVSLPPPPPHVNLCSAVYGQE